jgi:threonine aldolase
MSAAIDLRSDTVTRPGPAMRAAMHAAEVGDDDYGADPTVKLLQQRAAQLFGFEDALFVPSGTQSNLIALMTHCERGDEYLVGQEAHAYRFEGGGAAVLGSIQPQPLPNQPDGSIAVADIVPAIKPLDNHFARTRLLALENTIGGRVLGLGCLRELLGCAREHGLATHLDGARVCNAAVRLGVAPAILTRDFDSASVCLSKGLGAPVGSVLCGSGEFIHRATRWRKMLGGGMRQAGSLAAAGLYALDNHIERLAQDHANAALLAEGLSAIGAFPVQLPQTNVVYADIPAALCADLSAWLQDRNITARVSPRMRMLTHLDVSRDDIERVVAAFSDFFGR